MHYTSVIFNEIINGNTFNFTYWVYLVYLSRTLLNTFVTFVYIGNNISYIL